MGGAGGGAPAGFHRAARRPPPPSWVPGVPTFAYSLAYDYKVYVGQWIGTTWTQLPFPSNSDTQDTHDRGLAVAAAGGNMYLAHASGWDPTSLTVRKFTGSDWTARECGGGAQLRGQHCAAPASPPTSPPLARPRPPQWAPSPIPATPKASPWWQTR